MKKKSYEVKITHSYYLKAVSKSIAMRRSMERFIGRPNYDVAFDGVVFNCVIKDPPAPVPFPEKKSRITTVIGKDSYDYIKPNLDRNRTDSKEQDYIHFSATDEL